MVGALQINTRGGIFHKKKNIYIYIYILGGAINYIIVGI